MPAHRPIREATPADNEQLIELARSCPIQGNLQFYSDRYPDFFALLRLQGEKAHIFVAENDEDRIVACAVFVEKNVLWDGQLVKTLHFGDLRTDPSMRRTRVALQFIKIYDRMLVNGDYHHGIAEFAAGSNAVNAQKHFSKDIDVQYDGRLRMFQLIPIWNYRVSRRWQYRRAQADDLPAISALLQNTYRNSPGAPPFTPEWLDGALGIHPSFSIDNLWVATTEAGEVVASVGLWDQSEVRQVVATKFSRIAKMAVRFFAATGVLFRLPPVPEEGKPLSYMIFRWPAMKGEGAEEPLKHLMRFLMNRVRKGGKHQFVTAGFHEHDRMIALLRGFIKVEDQVQIYSHQVVSRQASFPARVQETRPLAHYADLAIV